MFDVLKRELKRKPAQRKVPGNSAPAVPLREPPGSPGSGIIALQQTSGNLAVQRMLKSGAIRASLRIGQPNDIYEQEADRVADEIMRMPEPGVQRQCSPGRKCPIREEKEKKRRIQPKPGHSSPERASVPYSIMSGLGSGQPLDHETRAFFGPRFGADFRDVRVHTGSMAAKSAGEISARAYTYGSDIVFGKNQYAPGSFEGRRLLAHELTHVIHQGGAESGFHEEAVTPPLIQKLNTGPVLQRAGCPCCVKSVEIKRIDLLNSGDLEGHVFFVEIGLDFTNTGTPGKCTLEWWEKRTYIPDSGENTPWENMVMKTPDGDTMKDWRGREDTSLLENRHSELQKKPDGVKEEEIEKEKEKEKTGSKKDRGSSFSKSPPIFTKKKTVNKFTSESNLRKNEFEKKKSGFNLDKLRLEQKCEDSKKERNISQEWKGYSEKEWKTFEKERTEFLEKEKKLEEQKRSEKDRLEEQKRLEEERLEEEDRLEKENLKVGQDIYGDLFGPSFEENVEEEKKERINEEMKFDGENIMNCGTNKFVILKDTPALTLGQESKDKTRTLEFIIRVNSSPKGVCPTDYKEVIAKQVLVREKNRINKNKSSFEYL
ncbi:MAG: DUF4157 domain-containing protein [Clostridia bacterium]|jgi:hypothetical protein